MHRYKLLGKKGEGTFSEVLLAQTVKGGKQLAIKCMKHCFSSLEQVNSLREIQALRRLSPHPNIVKLHEVLYDQPTGRLALVFELLECNIYEQIKGRTVHLKVCRARRRVLMGIHGADQYRCWCFQGARGELILS